MSTIAYLSGRLPDGEANGLTSAVADMTNDPADVRAMVVLFDCPKVTVLTADGTRIPTLRIRRCEVISDPTDRQSLRRLLMREYERRTGQLVLPLELEHDVEAAFGDITPDDPPPDAGDNGKRRRR